MARTINEPAREIPVVESVDVCVVGGSCTGVFAAVRAARLGARVALVEKQNAFGGTATCGLVNIWHSLRDTEFKRPIIGGLTVETIDRLRKRDAVSEIGESADVGYRLNTSELKIELDELVKENGIIPFLHAFYAAPHVEGDRVQAVFVETKSGRAAIEAKVFVDASGDGDVAAQLGVPFTVRPDLQPPTMCSKILGFRHPDLDLKAFLAEHREEFGLEPDWGWSGEIPNAEGVIMSAEPHVFGVNAADARELTDAEIEGRRKVRAMMDMIRKYGPQERAIALLDLASMIGIRETRRFEAAYTLTEDDVLYGRRFDDAIANGSYRVDVHNPENGGFAFKYLNGYEIVVDAHGKREGRWREPSDENPTFYQVPYRTMVHERVQNLVMAGRMISTDVGSFGAVRVMVNLNQVGEAAGVAAALAARADGSAAGVDPADVREALADGGSIII